MTGRLGFLVLALLLAAGQVFATGAAEGTAQAAPTTIQWWMGWWWETQAPVVVQAFEKEHPDIRVRFETIPREGYRDKLITSILGGLAPDIAGVSWDMLGSLAEEDLLFLWDEHAKRFDMNDFYAGALEAVRHKGSIVAIPHRQTLSSAVYYNRGMLDAAGLSYPTKDWTFEDLRAYAKKLTAPPQYGYGLAAGTKELNHPMERINLKIAANGGTLFNQEMTRTLINEKAGINAVQYWVDLYVADKSVPPGSIFSTNHDAAQLFGAGRIAMWHGSEAMWDFLPKYATEEVVKRTANVASPERQAFLSGWALIVPKTAKNTAQAVEFTSWFIKNLGELTIRPPATKSANRNAKWSTDPRRSIWIEAMEWARPEIVTPAWEEISGIIVREFQDALLEKKTVKAAVDVAAKEVNAVLAGK